MLKNLLDLVKQKPRLIFLAVVLAVQVVELTGIAVPPEIVETVNDFLTVLVGGYVAFKSDQNSLL